MFTAITVKLYYTFYIIVNMYNQYRKTFKRHSVPRLKIKVLFKARVMHIFLILKHSQLLFWSTKDGIFSRLGFYPQILLTSKIFFQHKVLMRTKVYQALNWQNVVNKMKEVNFTKVSNVRQKFTCQGMKWMSWATSLLRSMSTEAIIKYMF